MNDIQKMSEPSTASLQADIVQTKESLAQTIRVLEAKLTQGDFEGKLDAKIGQIEERARELLSEKLNQADVLIREKMGEAKTLMTTEIVVAKTAIADEVDVLEAKAREGVGRAADWLHGEVYELKDSVNRGVRNAITGAKESLRAATVGRVERLASNVGETVNDTRTTIIETVRANPIPTALVGAGLAWLLINRTKDAQMKIRHQGIRRAPDASNIARQESPLLVAGAAIAFGALIGLGFRGPGAKLR